MSIDAIQRASKKIRPIVKETPILTSKQLSEKCNNDIFVKAEHLQTTGSFKIRGAMNKVSDVAAKGETAIIAASSGNHGQAVAFAAKTFGLQATIVVPEDAAIPKINAIQAYGANIIKHGYTSEERINYAKTLEGTFIPPYDDPLIMEGQGTAGLEILDQVKDIDIVLVPVGGGGLLSGVLLAIKQTNPAIKVIACEPAIADDTYQSYKQEKRVHIGQTETIADGLRTSIPGEMTFPIVQQYVDGVVLVTEEEIKVAMMFMYERMKQVVEPSGAVTIAACLGKKLQVTGKRIVPIVSGGNVDLFSLHHYLP